MAEIADVLTKGIRTVNAQPQRVVPGHSLVRGTGGKAPDGRNGTVTALHLA